MASDRARVGVFAAVFVATIGFLVVPKDGFGSESEPESAAPTATPIPFVEPSFTITSVEPAVDSLAVAWTVEGDWRAGLTQRILYRYGDTKSAYVLEDESRTATISELPADTEVRFCLVVTNDDGTGGSVPSMPEGDAPGCATDKTLPTPPAPESVAAPIEPVQESVQQVSVQPPAPASVAVSVPIHAPAPAPQPTRAAPQPRTEKRGQQERGDDDHKGRGKQDDRKGHGKKD